MQEGILKSLVTLSLKVIDIKFHCKDSYQKWMGQGRADSYNQ